MIRINLLPVRAIRAESGRRQQLVVGIATIVATVAALALVFVFQSFRLSRLKGEVGGLEQEIQKLSAQLKETGDLKRQVQDLGAKLKVIEDLNKRKAGPARVMETLTTVVPATLWIAEFRESGGNLNMRGYAVDNQTIADFLRALAASPYFADVDLGETVQVQEGGATLKMFAVSSKLVYNPPAPTPPKAAPEPKPKGGKN